MSAHHNHAGASAAPFPLDAIPNLEAGALLRILLLSARELLFRGFKSAGGWRSRARQRRDLLRLDDHLLQDIGVTRQQVRQEAVKVFWWA